MNELPTPAGEFLPHAEPMLCIDRLLSASAMHAEAETTLFAGHTLLHGGLLSEAGYIEIAAQTAGAMKGYGEKLLGLPVRNGFLAAVQDFSIHAEAREGDVLHTSISLQAEVAGVSLLEAVIIRAPRPGESVNGQGTLAASGKLKVFVFRMDTAGE